MGEFNPELNVQDETDELVEETEKIDNIKMNYPKDVLFIDIESIDKDDKHTIDLIFNISNNKYRLFPSENPIIDIPIRIKEDKICNFVILTKNIGKFNKNFPNNVIDINGKTQGKIERSIKCVLNKGRKDVEELDNIWMTSDTHFSHGNIIKYCNRPWNSGKDSNGDTVVTQKNIDEMNEEMIKRWNSVVPKDGIVYHLGDFALGDRNKIKDILPRLNGKINLIMGNHDTKSVDFYYDCGFNRVYDHPILLKDFFILSHEPLSFLNKNSCFGNIFGHVHDSEVYKTFSPNSCCVCVERHDYKPISLKYIIDKCKESEDNKSDIII